MKEGGVRLTWQFIGRETSKPIMLTITAKSVVTRVRE